MNRLPQRQPLAITMGDPTGIGPEIIARAFARGTLQDSVVVADLHTMRRAMAATGLNLPVAKLERPHDLAELPPGALPVLVPHGMPSGLAGLAWGVESAAAGRAAACCIESAVAWVQAGAASAMVTAPIHKGAFHAAGVPYPGHTEYLQSLCTDANGALPAVRMMLANDQLRVVLATIHMSLRAALDALSAPLIFETIRLAHEVGLRMGLRRPRIGVAGVNPHAGEDGLFGDEEGRLIAPAVAQAQACGWNATGPYPPDTVFMRAREAPDHPGEFDIVVAMTHDHGLIPVKYLGVEQGVNVTLGLPWIRTSPDHGTAFDIAGKGCADPSSLEAAVRMARRMSSVAAPRHGP